MSKQNTEPIYNGDPRDAQIAALKGELEEVRAILNGRCETCNGTGIMEVDGSPIPPNEDDIPTETAACAECNGTGLGWIACIIKARDKAQRELTEGDYWQQRATEATQNGVCPWCFASESHKPGCYVGELEKELEGYKASLAMSVEDELKRQAEPPKVPEDVAVYFSNGGPTEPISNIWHTVRYDLETREIHHKTNPTIEDFKPEHLFVPLSAYQALQARNAELEREVALLNADIADMQMEMQAVMWESLTGHPHMPSFRCRFCGVSKGSPHEDGCAAVATHPGAGLRAEVEQAKAALNSVLANLRAAATRHNLGIVGENLDELVIGELERLRESKSFLRQKFKAKRLWYQGWLRKFKEERDRLAKELADAEAAALCIAKAADVFLDNSFSGHDVVMFSAAVSTSIEKRIATMTDRLTAALGLVEEAYREGRRSGNDRNIRLSACDWPDSASKAKLDALKEAPDGK